MDDLVDSVLVQLRVHDGCNAMSILWVPHKFGYLTLITPVQKDGRTTYMIRFSDSVTGFTVGNTDGFDVVEAVDVARFFLQHVKSRGCDELVGFRFVSTLDPKDGIPHTYVKADDVDGFVQFLTTLTSMRPLSGSV
jgi:hypothetical protein